MNSFLLQIVLFFSCCTYSFGQLQFDCNGRSYRVLAANDGTVLQEIQQNEIDQTISFNDLHFYPNLEINAIAYHPSQNVIYGVLQTPPYRLCRIDAAFNLEILKVLDLPEDLVYVSGDISPDEQHLVLFGFGDSNNENIVALIDVQNGQYDSQILSLQTTDPQQPNIFCADIAFHPTTGKLFGFDFKNGRLVTLDIASRLIENNVYPLSAIVVGNVPSIFFTDQGELFGIGTNLQEETENRAYYQFDLATGQPTVLQEMEIEKNQDACSCPYKIKLLNEVRQRKNVPCTELAFEITLINKTDIELFDLTLRDTFPKDITIKSITSPLPFPGMIENSIGNNILTIKNLELPIGTFSFEIILDIDENTPSGNYENRAFLTGMTLTEVDLDSIFSDDPQTAIPNDATNFSIDSLGTPFDGQFFGICEGGEVTLNAGSFGANSYEWSTGETTGAITVFEEGNYQVTVTTACSQIFGTATVTPDEIDMELGRNLTVEKGDLVRLKPNYNSRSHIKSFNWQTDIPQNIDCTTCKNLEFRPSSDTEVHLMMENASGCRANDRLSLKVVEVNIFSPSAFSPNHDNINDYFYLHGNLPFDIAQFQIYDRWGNLLFQNKHINANEPESGWDGSYNGKECAQGVYLWTAVVAYKTGEQEILSGDITLLR